MTEDNHLSDTKFKPGWKGGPGRPSKLKTQVKDWIKEHPYAVAALMQVLYEKGIQGDRECAMYVIDRIKGKPTSKIGIDEEDKDLLSAVTMIEFFKLQDAHRKRIGEGNAIQGQGIEEGSFEEINGEEEAGVNIRD